MAKQPPRKRAAKPEAVPAPPTSLIDVTERGFEALKSRRDSSTAGGKPGKKSQAFSAAVDRLKADYQRLLKRTK